MKSKKEPDSSERALLLRLLDANLPESPPHDVSRSSRKVSFRTSAVPRRGRQATSVRALATKFNALSETHPTATTKVTLGRRASREEPRRRAAVAVAGNVKAAIRIFEQGAEDATPPAKRASELPHANAPGAKHYCVVSNGDDACDEDGFRPCTTVERLSSQPKPKTVLQGSETYVRTVRRETKLTVAEVVAIDAQVLDEDDEYEAIQVPSMLPNSSFLWRSSKIPASTASAPDDYDDVQPYESEDTLYDDVGQPDSDGYEYCDDVVEYDDCNIYDDVRTDAQQDLYEPIYGAAEVAAPSCSSNSSCDQSNSLYGVASTVYAEGHSSNGSAQQVPRSETSDEWVDLEQSDVEQIHKNQDSLNNKHLLQERARSRTNSAWSYKVRKQRLKSQREESHSSSDNENTSDSDTDHHYEMLEDVVNPNSTCADNSPFDDFDSFDSDDSVEAFGSPENQDICNGRLPAPPPPQNIYGITKIAEVAGRKMLKLRKSFGRMRTSKRHLHVPVSTTATQGIKPQPPPPPLEKANSAGTLSTPNRYFSLRKFKKSVYTPTQNSLKETSTFYLSNDSTSEHNSRHADDDLIVTSSSTQTLVSENGTSSSLNLSNGGRNQKTTSDRRASAPARPNSPPPLPPADASKKLNKKEKKNSNTSWYAECGLFDRRVSLNFETSKKVTNKEITPNCWYAEVGLWDGRSSPHDSSLSEQDNSQVTDVSEYSTSQENSGILTYFKDEPLYQFYNATVVELAQKEMQGELDSDGYEEIGADGMLKLKSRPTAMELIQPRDGLQRTLWCEIPEVVNSRVLSTLNIHQKKLQEAKFEIITSEASYVNSLNVLQNHFISSPEFCDMSILSKNDKRILFGNVLPVKICSEKFLAELEECWQDNILLHGICDVIYKHATKNFNVYIKYCSNQIYLDRTLRRLRDQYDNFSEVLQKLESSPECQALSLHSFLMLPMQRITRLPLLVDAMLSRLHPEDDEYNICELALAALNKVVQDCNEGARRMERMEEILILSRQLEFPKEIKPIPIISSTRWLVRCGEVTQLLCRGEDVRLTFGKRFSKITLHLYLFTDLLVVTKKKSEECFIVLDYCPRNLVQMTSADSVPHLPVRTASDGGKNFMMLTMLQNHENKTSEMFLSCSLESDRQRWLEAVMPPASDNPEESVYEQWDCPQVQTLHPYTGQQPDELSLAMSDVVNVLRKVADGWYYGERIRDGEKGWFPGNHTVEIASAHVRAKNLKQRHRLLTLSGTFLESQRKHGK